MNIPSHLLSALTESLSETAQEAAREAAQEVVDNIYVDIREWAIKAALEEFIDSLSPGFTADELNAIVTAGYLAGICLASIKGAFATQAGGKRAEDGHPIFTEAGMEAALDRMSQQIEAVANKAAELRDRMK